MSVCIRPPQMDLNSLSRINAIGNISDFASLFGIDLPIAENSGGDFAIASRFGGSGGEPVGVLINLLNAGVFWIVHGNTEGTAGLSVVCRS